MEPGDCKTNQLPMPGVVKLHYNSPTLETFRGGFPPSSPSQLMACRNLPVTHRGWRGKC